MFGNNVFWKADPINIGIGLKKYLRQQRIIYIKSLPLTITSTLVHIFFKYCF